MGTLIYTTPERLQHLGLQQRPGARIVARWLFEWPRVGDDRHVRAPELVADGVTAHGYHFLAGHALCVVYSRPVLVFVRPSPVFSAPPLARTQ